MFVSLKQNYPEPQLILVQKDDYLEVEFFAPYEFDTVEALIVRREDFASREDFSDAELENENLRWILKKTIDFPVGDYHVWITGVDGGLRTEIAHFAISVKG